MRGQKLSKQCSYCKGTGINPSTKIHIDKNGEVLQVTPELLRQMKRLKTRERSGCERWFELHNEKMIGLNKKTLKLLKERVKDIEQGKFISTEELIKIFKDNDNYLR